MAIFAQFRRGQNLPERLIGRSRSQREWREKNQLPHIKVGSSSMNCRRIQLAQAQPRWSPPKPFRREHIQSRKWRAMHNMSRSDALALNRNRRGITRSAPYFERNSATWSTPFRRGTMAPKFFGCFMEASAHQAAWPSP